MKYHSSSSTYATSAVKSVVDSWATSKFTDQLKTVDGYSARLITKTEYEAISAYSWRYNSSYLYWTMSPYFDTAVTMWNVYSDGRLSYYTVYADEGAVRPVINVYKSKISS